MWKLVERQHNIFGDHVVIQVFYNDDIRGSFTVHADDLEDARKFWKSIIPYDTTDG